VEQALKRRSRFSRFAQAKGAQIMSARAISQAVLYSLLMVGVFSPARALTQQELVAKLEAAGYSQIRDIKSTAEGTAVKATKNGKEVSLVVDSSGQIQERR
jgi:Peptidase propeptide and YPEB domain